MPSLEVVEVEEVVAASSFGVMMDPTGVECGSNPIKSWPSWV